MATQYETFDPLQATMGGLRLGAGLNALDAQKQEQAMQQQAMQQQGQQRQLFMSVLSNPNATASDYGAIASFDPKFRETIQDAWTRKTTEQQNNILSLNSRVYSALQNKRPDIAKQLALEHVTAMKNSGASDSEIQAAQSMADMVDQAPDYARVLVGSTIASTPGGDKVFSSYKTMGEEQRATEKQPLELGKMRVDIQDTVSKVAERGERIGLDRDKFNLDFDVKLQELKGKQGAPALSAGMEKTQAEGVANALSAQDLSTKALNLADAIRREGQWGGAATWLTSKAKDAAGFDGGMNALRREYVALRNKGVIEGLPPGVATDKDIELIKSGFPSENASQEVMANWLESFSRVQKGNALKEEAKAEWISNVGSLRNAPQDIEVMGKTIPSGMSFNDFIRKGLTEATEQRTQRPRYLDYGR